MVPLNSRAPRPKITAKRTRGATVPEPISLVNDSHTPALAEASLSLLVQERMVVVLNAKTGTVMSVNDRVLQTTDLPLADLAGRRLEDVWHLQSQIVDQ